MLFKDSDNKYFMKEFLNKLPDDLPARTVPSFDGKAIYTPVFANCIVPEDYLNTLCAASRMDNADLIPVQVREEDTRADVVARLRDASGYEMTEDNCNEGWTGDDFLAFWKNKLRAPEDGSERRSDFSTFTFAFIDEDCLDQKWPKLKICTDAPDQRDDLSGMSWSDDSGDGRAPPDWQPQYPTPVNRVLTTPLLAAPQRLMCLETLVTTVTEFVEKREMHVSTNPPAKFSGPPEMQRKVKWEAIAAQEIMNSVPDVDGQLVVGVTSEILRNHPSRLRFAER